jgi:hypothetical protein
MIETLQSHWGFTVMPFTAAIPVPGLFGSAAHKEAVARLRWLISARGLGVLTGEVGSGKTVALRAAADGLDASRHTLIYLPNPQVGVRGIHGAVAMALGQAPRFHHATLIPQVEAALAAEADERNRHAILAIDESHLMSGDQLEAVRMLTSHDLDSRSPLTILLIGQPTLRRGCASATWPPSTSASPCATTSPRPRSAPAKPAGTSAGTSSTPGGQTPSSATMRCAPSTPTPAACPGPSTGWRSPRCWPPAPQARPSSMSPRPAPRSARRPPPRQTDHHAATRSTTTPPGTPPAGVARTQASSP